VTTNTIRPFVNNEFENNTTKGLDSSTAYDNGRFGNILLVSSVGQRNRRTWVTATSFLLQFLLIGFLLIASVMVHRGATQAAIAHISGGATSSSTCFACSGEDSQGHQLYREWAVAHSKQNSRKSQDD